MTTRRTDRWIAGFGACFVLLIASAPNRADDAKSPVKWDTKRTSQPEDLDELKALQERVKGVVEKCSPSTVAILIGGGAGSGVIVSEDGLVLTAAHVIAGEPKLGKGPSYEPNKECMIILSDGKKVAGKTLGINDKMDSGMVRITTKGPNDGKWPFIPMAKSAEVQKGQWVVSLGHPGGPKEGRSPVARLGRMEVPLITNGINKGLSQSNCTLVGGDSGGPLFDLDGRVIGIHSRIGLSIASNYHVPTDQYTAEWDQLVNGDVIGRKPVSTGAYLGVVFAEDENDDAWLAEVEDEGPAAKAGLKPGDTITKFNGEAVKSVKRFRELIKEKKPGEAVKLSVRRGVEILNISVTLGKRA